MALDGLFLHMIKKETEVLIGGRVDKIYQPSRDEIVLAIRSNSGMKRLMMSSSANSARVHLTEAEMENPKIPPRFCMLLRKHINSGKLIDIRQDGLERILYFEFESMNEIGDMVKITLACEIMGRCSNIILINQDGKIMDSIKRVDESMSRERLVLPGMIYENPPRDDRINILTSTKEEIKDKILTQNNAELSKCLIKAFEGISPVFARECVYNASKMEVYKDEITSDMMDKLLFYIMRVRESIENEKNKYCVIEDKQKNLKDFCFTDIHQYGTLMITKEFDSASIMLDYFYSERDNINRMKQRSHDLLKLLVNMTERITRKLALQEKELEECANRDTLKIKGDLISSNIYCMEKGMEKVKLQNYYSENAEEVEILLDKRLTPSQNAQKYYAEYRKAATAEKKLLEQMAEGKADLQYLDSVFDALSRSTTENEMLLLRLELAEQGFVKANRLKQKPPKTLPPMEFISSDGYKILVGRNNKENDKLTLKTAAKSDVWLHTKNIPGSHVIIVADGKEVPVKTIEEAAIIAAYHSKGRSSSQVPVDYVPVKFVKKPQGAKPGMVIFTNNRTLYVTPDGELVSKLKSR